MKKKLAVFGIAAVIIAGIGIDSIEAKAAPENQGCVEVWEEISEWGAVIVRELKEVKGIGDALPSAEEIKEVIASQPIQAVRGTIQNGIFRNEVFKIAFPVDERKVCSDEFMFEIFQLDKSVLDEKGQCSSEAMENLTGGTSYDLLMEMPNGRSTFCIFYEKQTMNMTETAYIAMIMLQMAANEEDITFGKVTDVNIGGQTYLLLPVIRTDLTQFIYVRQQANYIVSFLYTCSTDEDPGIREGFIYTFLTVE